jgi:hypothetical protein
MAKSKCFDCEDRHVGCHSTCKSYDLYKQQLENAKPKKDQDYISYLVDITYKNKTRSR